MIGKEVAASDVVITTAAVPGRRRPSSSPRPWWSAWSRGRSSSTWPADGGGNCELTEAGKEIDHNGVVVSGLSNPPSAMPTHASFLSTKSPATDSVAIFTPLNCRALDCISCYQLVNSGFAQSFDADFSLRTAWETQARISARCPLRLINIFCRSGKCPRRFRQVVDQEGVFAADFADHRPATRPR